jgi:hypothetical protein
MHVEPYTLEIYQYSVINARKLYFITSDINSPNLRGKKSEFSVCGFRL